MSALIIKHAKKIEKLFILLCILSVILMPFVKVNYDLAEYLPDWAPSKAGLNVMEEEFGYPGTARVMVDDVTLYEAKNIKDQIEAVPNVDMVMWCDLADNIYTSSSFIDYESIEDYYKDGSAVYDIIFKYADTDNRTSEAVDQIRSLVGEKGSMVGMAVQTQSLERNVAEEMSLILTIAVGIIFLILLLTTSSWFEPVLFLTVMGVAILINKGSNVFLGTISFLTDNVVAVLQLAVSMDYSIFLLHAFTRYQAKGEEQATALKHAVDEAISSILASSLTTIVGFVVLMVMRFRIGFDLGLVLAKGVAISLATVIFFMPAMIIRMEPLLKKTAHKSFLPSFHKTCQGIYRIRYGVLILVALVTIPLYVAQGMNSYQYGNSSVGASPGTEVYEAEEHIAERFGRSNMMMAIIPNDDMKAEREMAEELDALPYVKSVLSLGDMLPAGIPVDFLPESVTGLLYTDDYARVMVYTRTKEESETAFQSEEEIMNIIQRYYPTDSYLVGGTPSTMDIRDIITADYEVVNALSLLGVFLVVMFTYRSLLIPLIVMIPIQVAIFANMAIPYIKGESVVYIGYIIVGCIQLGATVDYSILTTGNYVEARKRMPKKEAAIFTLERSIPAIFTSGSILTACGYILYAISSISAIGDLGHLIGRGAWMSVLLVLTLLPALLMLADPLLARPLGQRLKEWLGKRRQLRRTAQGTGTETQPVTEERAMSADKAGKPRDRERILRKKLRQLGQGHRRREEGQI